MIGLHAETRNGQRAYSKRVTESGGEIFEVVHAFGIRRLVHAIEGGNALGFKVGRDSLIGRQHELFDEAMREEALGTRDSFHQSVLIELDERLGKIEVDGAAALALFGKDLGELLHEQKIFDERSVTLAGLCVTVEDLLHASVGHAFGRADDAGHDFVRTDFTARVDLHDAGHDEAVALRTQRADVR